MTVIVINHLHLFVTLVNSVHCRTYPEITCLILHQGSDGSIEIFHKLHPFKIVLFGNITTKPTAGTHPYFTGTINQKRKDTCTGESIYTKIIADTFGAKTHPA